MQGPRGPGSLRDERRRGDPIPEPGEILRQGDEREKTVVVGADAQPLVNVAVRADSTVQTLSTPL
jgi:hypothetical protein